MSDRMPVRIKVTSAWDEILLDLPATTPIGDLKREALVRARITDDPARFIIKYRGGHLADESQSMAEAGIVPNAPLIVLPWRRQPVK